MKRRKGRSVDERLSNIESAIMQLADSIEDGNFHGIRADIRYTLFPSLKRHGLRTSSKT